MAIRKCAFLLVGGILLVACTRTGDVTGDVYITMQSGDVKRGADVEVVLVLPTAEFEKDWAEAQASFRGDLKKARAAAAAATSVREQRSKEGEAAGSDLTKNSAGDGFRVALDRYSEASKRSLDAAINQGKAEAATERAVALHRGNALKVIEKHQIASVRADVNGHYAKRELTPGRYYVFSAHRVFNNIVVWFQPINIQRGSSTKLDLTLSNSGWPFDASDVK